MTGGQLIIGCQGPADTWVRLARPGDERAVLRFIRMAGVDEDHPAEEGTRNGSVAAALIAAADQGRGPLDDWVEAAVTAAHDPTHLWPAMTLVLMALDQAGNPVGTLLAHPPMNVINQGINLGIPVPVMMQTAAFLARIKALAIDPAWRGQGIGGALIGHCLALYAQLGYLILYGQFSIAEKLEDYYPRFGFDVLDPGYGFSLAGLVGVAYNIGPGPGERLIIQAF